MVDLVFGDRPTIGLLSARLEQFIERLGDGIVSESQGRIQSLALIRMSKLVKQSSASLSSDYRVRPAPCWSTAGDAPQTVAEARYGALKAGWGQRRLDRLDQLVLGEGIELVGRHEAFGDSPGGVVRVGLGQGHPEVESGRSQDAGERGDRRRAETGLVGRDRRLTGGGAAGELRLREPYGSARSGSGGGRRSPTSQAAQSAPLPAPPTWTVLGDAHPGHPARQTGFDYPTFLRWARP